MTEQPDRETAGHHAAESVTGGAHLEKGLHHGQPGQELGTNLEMPNELPPGPPAVSPPPPASASEQVTPATDAGE